MYHCIWMVDACTKGERYNFEVTLVERFRCTCFASSEHSAWNCCLLDSSTSQSNFQQLVALTISGCVEKENTCEAVKQCWSTKLKIIIYTVKPLQSSTMKLGYNNCTKYCTVVKHHSEDHLIMGLPKCGLNSEVHLYVGLRISVSWDWLWWSLIVRVVLKWSVTVFTCPKSTDSQILFTGILCKALNLCTGKPSASPRAPDGDNCLLPCASSWML